MAEWGVALMRRASVVVACLVLAGLMVFATVAMGARITGSSGPDNLVGTGDRDRIAGGGGDDIVTGKGSNDRLDGDSGDDLVRGNKGKDKIFGSAGNDLLRGGQGADDIVSTGGNNDTVRCGPGVDRARVGSGDSVGGGCETVVVG